MLIYKEMRKKLALAIVSVVLFSGLITACAQSALPQAVPAPSSDTPPEAVSIPPSDTLPTDFYLEVTQPTDNIIFSLDAIEVTGRTSPGAVVSVNDEITMADTQGIFTITITLEEGPNIIEIIASDEAGNEATTSLTVTLVKGE